jgi:hypothetical protein
VAHRPPPHLCPRACDKSDSRTPWERASTSPEICCSAQERETHAAHAEPPTPDLDAVRPHRRCASLLHRSAPASAPERSSACTPRRSHPSAAHAPRSSFRAYHTRVAAPIPALAPAPPLAPPATQRMLPPPTTHQQLTTRPPTAPRTAPRPVAAATPLIHAIRLPVGY